MTVLLIDWNFALTNQKNYDQVDVFNKLFLNKLSKHVPFKPIKIKSRPTPFDQTWDQTIDENPSQLA